MNIENTLLLNLAGRLKPEHFPFLALSHNPIHGWTPVLGWEPVDVFQFDHNLSELNHFFENNKRRLVAGFIGYDAGMELLGVKPDKPSLLSIPGAWFAAYENFAIVKNGKIISYGLELPEGQFQKDNSNREILFKPLTHRNVYDESLRQIKEHIIKGNIYQANLTHFLEAKWSGDSWKLFQNLYKHNQVDFGACIMHPDFSIYSLSPEKFISTIGNSLYTEPIKGTRPRGRNEQDDARKRAELLASEKEAAELNMITDLLRNDLSRICKAGTVELVRHRQTMALPTVWHTYSTVKGELSEEISLVSGILSMLPGGSITGCPKKRAVEIISGLEVYNRNLYTGTIGYQLPDGSSSWNIAIRTILQEQDRLYLGVGGGITLDSIAEDEYNETLAKAKSFMEILA